MQRTFYLVIKALRHLQDEPEKEIVEKLFPLSDVKAHVADKLSSYLNRGSNFYHAIFDLYEGLDAEHQLWFDEAINKEVAFIEERFSPRELAPNPDVMYGNKQLNPAALTDLYGACLMAKEELVFGGDWINAHRVIDEAVTKAQTL